MTSKEPNPCRKSYFSMLEILIVLTLLVLVFGLVLPKIGVIPVSVRMKNASRSFDQCFLLARQIAKSTGEPVVVTLKDDSLSIQDDRSDFLNGQAVFSMPPGFQVVSQESNEMIHYRFFASGEAEGEPLKARIDDTPFTIIIDELTGKPTLLEVAE